MYMKIIKNGVIGVCLFTAISGTAQEKGNDTTTKFIPPVIVKDEDSVHKSEMMKKEYKSKEWRQGNEVITDTSKEFGGQPKSRMEKKTKKPRKPAPPAPPPAPALPPAPPSPPAKE